MEGRKLIGLCGWALERTACGGLMLIQSLNSWKGSDAKKIFSAAAAAACCLYYQRTTTREKERRGRERERERLEDHQRILILGFKRDKRKER